MNKGKTWWCTPQSEETLHKATDPSSRSALATDLFRITRALWLFRIMGDRINPATQALSDESARTTQYSVWVMRLIMLPKLWVVGALSTLKTWVVGALSSLRAWVVGSIQSPTILSSQSALVTLKRFSSWNASTTGISRFVQSFLRLRKKRRKERTLGEILEIWPDLI